MSQRAYNDLWADAQLELSRILAEEQPAEQPQPQKDRVVFFQRVAMLYVRYIQILRKLQKAHELIIHPQKRRAIRKVIDSVMGRVVELKNEMVEKEFLEYHYMDDILHDMKLTPDKLEIPLPQYFPNDHSKEVQERKAMLMKIFKMVEATESLEVSQKIEAIRVIQVAERARQGRMRSKLYEESREASLRSTNAGIESTELAAICIQKVWRGYIQRKKTKIERVKELIALGMYLAPRPAEVALLAAEACTRLKQQEHEAAYQKAVVAVTIQLREMEGNNMSNTLKSQVREWFFKCRNVTGSFPDYPDEEDGGSAFIFAEKSPQQIDLFFTSQDFWRSRDETENLSQKHDVELIKEERRKVVEDEIRVQVDEQMRQELAELKLSVDKDKGGKTKLVSEMLHLSHACELLYIKKLFRFHAPPSGDFNYLGTTLRQNDIEPMPSLSDVRQVISLYAILPLGSQVVHEKAPLIKSILLVGPEGAGKKMLVHAVCQETGATLFDLSPLNTAGKYPGKSGLAMMVHVVFKVARLLQPSVIWIGDAEKMFYKKVPKEEKELDPKRLKKDLPKSLKLIKGEDRVLIIGTTEDPMSADIKSMCKMYNKILLIPRPDYGSRYIMWKELINQKGGETTKALDLSSLAKISDGYTPGHMVKAIQSVVTERRIRQQGSRPLTAAEFVTPLARIDPVFQEQEEALKNWYAKTPLGRKRVKAATGKEEEQPPVKGKGAKKKT
uniref:IQ motif containing with AAA domain 1 n=1 Tax=Oryzias sinensis TaxID=183150 RepID=A0A8C7XE57_9TELE